MQPEAKVVADAKWLRSVLTNRGMPSLLLERHLVTLGRMIQKRIRPADGRGEKLLHAAQGLRADQVGHVEEAEAASLAAGFASGLGAPVSRLLLGTGELLAAAIADARGGARKSVGSLVAWLGGVPRLARDPQQLPGLDPAMRQPLLREGADRRWQNAIDQTLVDAGWCPAAEGVRG